MADILDAAQSNTPASPVGGPTPPPPVEPPPPPAGGPPAPPVIPEPPVAPEPPAINTDSLIIPPPEPTAPEPTTISTPPPPPPKKKSRLGVLLAGLLLLVITIPILTIFVKQQVEIRSRASGTTQCKIQAGKENILSCQVTCGGITNPDICNDQTSCCYWAGTTGGSSGATGTSGSGGATGSGGQTMWCACNTSTQGACNTYGGTTQKRCVSANGLCTAVDSTNSNNGYWTDCSTGTPTFPVGKSCTTAGGYPGNCSVQTSCDTTKPGTAWESSNSACSPLGCCGVRPANVTTTPTFPVGNSCTARNGNAGTCSTLANCPTTNANTTWDSVNSACGTLGCCAVGPPAGQDCNMKSGSAGTCSTQPNCNTTWDSVNSACGTLGCCALKSTTGTTGPTGAPTCIYDHRVPKCVGTQMCDVPIGEMGWKFDGSCPISTTGGAQTDSCKNPYYCTSARSCIRNGECTPTNVGNKNCREDASCTGTTPPPQCINIIAYKDGNALSAADLSALQPGDTIELRFAPGGAATKVRFIVNAGSPMETSNKNANGQFYVPYTLENTTSFTIEAQWFNGSAWN